MFKNVALLTTGRFSKIDLLWITCLLCVFTVISSTFAVGAIIDYEYSVSPGDDLYISVWGQESMSGSTTVGPDGTILLPPPIGSVYVNQMTAREITNVLTERLKEYVKQPVVTVSIRSFQGILVHILGQVNLPSFYKIANGTSLQELVTNAGGFSELADLSSIILRRVKDKETGEVEARKIDFSKFLKNIDMESNPILQADDVVIVPSLTAREKVGRSVIVIGEVFRPGSYDLEAPVSFMDIMSLAGGVSNRADVRKIFIMGRSEDEGKMTSRQVDLDSVFSKIGNPDLELPIVSPGEIVFVPVREVLDALVFPVNVIGQVANQGSYQVPEDTRLIDAIFRAGGPAEGASLENIAILHSNYSPITTFSLSQYLISGNLDSNPLLSKGDTIFVPMIESAKVITPVQTAFSKSITVNIIGEVGSPGSYQVSTESNLLDVLTLANGPTTDANLKKTMVIRREKSNVENRLIIDLEKVMTEGQIDILPVLVHRDTVFVPKIKERRDWWRLIVGTATDIATMIGVYYLLVGKRYQ